MYDRGMRQIDDFSYRLGIMDCFNEMVKAGLKPMALAHPYKDKKERDEVLPYVIPIVEKYGNMYYLDDDPLLTDLFPLSQNKDTFNIIFYREDKTIETYKDLKLTKAKAIEEGIYQEKRKAIAYDFGHLLGYRDADIARYIALNSERE